MRIIAALTALCSLALAAPALASPLQTVQAKGFSFKMPGEVKAQVIPADGDNAMTQDAWSSVDEGVVYVVISAELPPEAVAEEDATNKFLSGVLDGMTQSSKGTVSDKTAITVDGHAGLDFAVKSETDLYLVRVAYDGARGYSMLARYKPDTGPGQARAFLQSLKIGK